MRKKGTGRTPDNDSLSGAAFLELSIVADKSPLNQSATGVQQGVSLCNFG